MKVSERKRSYIKDGVPTNSKVFSLRFMIMQEMWILTSKIKITNKHALSRYVYNRSLFVIFTQVEMVKE